MRRLGVDPGERRIGLALSDEDGRVAMPLKTLARASDDSTARAIADEATAAAAAEIVVGLPLALDGSEGMAARRARALASRIGALATSKVVMWDERLTTAAATRALRDAGVRGRDQRAVVDQAAATLMLQCYLDASSGGTTWDPETDAAPEPARGRTRRGRGARGGRASRR